MSSPIVTLRHLMLGGCFAAWIVTGLGSTAMAQSRRPAVSPFQAQILIWRFNRYKGEAIQIQNRYRALKTWCNNNWRLGHTPLHRRFQAEMKSLKIRYNRVRHYMRMAEAEYHGRQGGFVAALPDDNTWKATFNRNRSRTRTRSRFPIRFFSGGGHRSISTNRTGRSTSRGSRMISRTNRRTNHTPVRNNFRSGSGTIRRSTGNPGGGLLNQIVRQPVIAPSNPIWRRNASR